MSTTLSDKQLAILEKEFEQGLQRICLMDVHLLIGDNVPFTYRDCVYGYKPVELVKQDEQLIHMITIRLSDSTKSIGKSQLKHKGKTVVKIKSITYTHMTHGYKKL